jgi:hypothetical protein
MTEDERHGMEWWNSQTEADRAAWLTAALSARPVDAWLAYKQSWGPKPEGTVADDDTQVPHG